MNKTQMILVLVAFQVGILLMYYGLIESQPDDVGTLLLGFGIGCVIFSWVKFISYLRNSQKTRHKGDINNE